MILPTFLWRHLKGYLLWIGVALLGILVYAAAQSALVALVDPIFGEVLLAGSTQEEGMLGRFRTGSSRGDDSHPDRIERIFAFKRFLDSGYRWLKQRFGVRGPGVVFFAPLLFCAVFLLRSLADFVGSYSFKHLGLSVANDIRNELYRNILSQSPRFYAEHPSGELVSRVVNDIGVLQAAVSNRLLDLFRQPITLLGMTYLLFSTHFRLALVTLAVAPVLVVLILRFGEGMRRSSHRSQQRMADLANLVNEAVRGHRVVTAFGMEGFEYERFRRASGLHLKVNLWAQLLASLSGPAVASLSVLGATGLLIYAGLQIRQGTLDAPLLLSFIANLLLMYDPIRKLNKVNLVLQQSRAALERVTGLLAVPNEIVEHPHPRSLRTVRQGVGFDGVHFRYGEREVLRGIDLEIRCGEIVALVGPSGAGKTTLVNLLPRFFDPHAGRVTIDGTDIRELDLDSLHALIGIVTQETILFNDTIRNNIAYGRSDLPLERIREAAAAAYADAFIMELPEGYDTPLGEGGARLSGGQRQRLTIARAILKNPPILILDEATSHLDTESEALLQKALYNLVEGRTTLVIAHRLSTVTRADRILVMQDGRVVEEGTHEELLAISGVYKRLHDLEFRV